MGKPIEKISLPHKSTDGDKSIAIEGNSNIVNNGRAKNIFYYYGIGEKELQNILSGFSSDLESKIGSSLEDLVAAKVSLSIGEISDKKALGTEELKEAIKSAAGDIQKDLECLKEQGIEVKEAAERLLRRYDHDFAENFERIINKLDALEKKLPPDKWAEALPENSKELNIAWQRLYAADFVGAISFFDKATQQNDLKSEAYFGLALAKWRVQPIWDYIKDKWQLVCHDGSADLENSGDFVLAADYAGADENKKQYYLGYKENVQSILNEFDNYQKQGLDYDCFICVKVSDGDNKKTDDAFWVEEKLIPELKKNGVKAFYSEVTCPAVLKEDFGNGLKYEALILYGLTRAKCMIVVCSDEKYLETPWVKNEYTRFAGFLKQKNQSLGQILFVFNGTPVARPKALKDGNEYQEADRSKQDVGYVTDVIKNRIEACKGYAKRYSKYCLKCNNEYSNSFIACPSCKVDLIDPHTYLNEQVRKLKEQVGELNGQIHDSSDRQKGLEEQSEKDRLEMERYRAEAERWKKELEALKAARRSESKTVSSAENADKIADITPLTGDQGTSTREKPAFMKELFKAQKYKRVDAAGVESANGKYILFGEYPQTIKADSVSITSTTDSRGYYLGSDGAYYAMITANPCSSGYTFTTGATIKNRNTYYFKVEPIKWRILKKAGGKATLLCDMIIDARRFDDYSNNYKKSEIRAWLIGEFYQTAFNDLERQMINTVLVKNDARSTNPDNDATGLNDENEYVCEDTNDKVFLLSEREVTKASYGFATNPYNSNTARRKKTTDYARANYAYTHTSGDYAGNGCWWLRSPSDDDPDSSGNINYDGNSGNYFGGVIDTRRGVVPAIVINLDDVSDVVVTLEPEESRKAGVGSSAAEIIKGADITPLTGDQGTSTREIPAFMKELFKAQKYKRVDAAGVESAKGKYILFGEYPQTIKADNVNITSTTDSRGYYLGSDGAYYAKVTADPASSIYSFLSNYTFTTGATITSGTYYFKVEPIKWRILEEADGKATLLCEMIIDAHRFDDSSNNYKESEIRSWLIGEFYQTAFNDLEQQMINRVLVKNDARSTNPDNNAYEWNGGANQYACEDTNDKVFLLSEREVTKASYGFATSPSTYDTARCKKITDYAKVNYADTSTSGNGSWWLRSPYCDSSRYAWSVAYDGSSDSDFGLFGNSRIGVVPALQITL